MTTDSTSPEPVVLDSNSKGWAVAAHLVPLVGFSIFGPLFIWLIKKDEDPYVEHHAREALNFQISILIYLIASVVLMLILIGIVLFFAVAIFAFVMAIIAGVKASNGEMYQYPLTIRFVN